MSTLFVENRRNLNHLRHRWFFFACFSLALLATGFSWLHAAWHPGFALRWLGQAALVAAYLLWTLWRGLPENTRAGESQLLPTFGAGNNLTLLRGVLIAGLAGFLFLPRPEGWRAWIPGIVYTLAALMDYLDGYLARVSNHATLLGERLDISLDGVGVFTAALLAVQYGQVPVWYLGVALARPLYLAGLWLWHRLGRETFPLAHSIRRRAFAGLQMGFLFFVLWPIFTPPGTYVTAALLSLPFLAGFALDWLNTTGILHPPQQPTRQLSSATRWLPVLLRLAAAALVVAPLSQRLLHAPEQAASYASPGLPVAAAGLFLLVLLESAISVFLLLGAAGRFAAILGLVLLGVNQIFSPLNPAQYVLAGVYTAILYLGTGAYSLWTPEDRLIYRKAGEKRRSNPGFIPEVPPRRLDGEATASTQAELERSGLAHAEQLLPGER